MSLPVDYLHSAIVLIKFQLLQEKQPLPSTLLFVPLSLSPMTLELMMLLQGVAARVNTQ